MISLNTVYQFVDDNERIRIIHIARDNDLCAYVNLESSLSTPIIEMISVIEKKIDNNNLVEVFDPYIKIKSDNDLSEIEIRKRDEAWQIIEKYWESRKNDILRKKTRMQVFQEIAEIERIQLMAVRRIFSRFWQRGMTRNALLPDYSKSGGKGKEKNVKENKMGRRRVYSEDDSEGIVVTDVVKKHFEIATNKYWRTSQKKSLIQVYRLMLADFYSITVRKNKEIEKIIRGSDSIPTFQQYYYWFKKNENVTLDIKSRYGEKEFELKHRPILGSSTLEAPGPGFRFQIDATTADIYIVSEIDRSQVIGRPTVYIIIDVFSRMITGVYAGLESPSWNGAMMVLDSMVADKVELCKKYNINIEPEDWPCSYVPEAIIADRGEMEGYGVKNLINNLNITIENTSPYRGDYKGIVERFFRTINERIESFLPGAIMKDYRKRGDPDYRLEAKLTLKEITEIVLRSVLLHNIREIEKYPLTPEMIRDEVPPTPLDLWNWGIENKKGTLRKIDRNRFRMNILPRGKATISRGAVVFRNLYYGASELLDEILYKHLKLKSVDIVYDTRNIDHIYWLKEDGISYITFNLLERSRDFHGIFLEDVLSANNKAAKLRQAARKSQLQQETELDQTIMRIAKESTKKTNKAIDATVSKAKRLKDIGSNRAAEKERNRKEEAFTPDVDKKDVPSPIITFPDVKPQNTSQNESVAETSDFNSRMMEKIKLRKEKLRHDKNET
ncbi:hypothetical protein JT05_04935 [Desulfosporosinus sp. Tol-M]|nr:hypothetical protein JT05_04935 [Desulfosporosinus sp. Tol-M]